MKFGCICHGGFSYLPFFVGGGGGGGGSLHNTHGVNFLLLSLQLLQNHEKIYPTEFPTVSSKVPYFVVNSFHMGTSVRKCFNNKIKGVTHF